jgi:twitching motility protein PilT
MTDTSPPTLPDLLMMAASRGGSDLHVSVGSPPQIRVDGSLQRIDAPDLTPDVTQALACSVMAEGQRRSFEETWEADFACTLPGVGRVRCNVFRQKGAVAAVFRLIPAAIRSLEDLGLPPVLGRLADRPRGLVLVTGPTGSGKTTTLAAMIDRINTHRRAHILTIEDPIEFLHPHRQSLVNQREVHADTLSFGHAMRAALREDPDVVLVGELRDLETMEAAMTLAETGHLTLATLHTNSAAQTVTRLVDAFPAHQHAQIRTQLSLVLEGIVCQTLLPRAQGRGRVAALEVLVATPAIRTLIRDDKVHQISSAMQSGQEKFGMQTMNQALMRLTHARQITRETALMSSSNRDDLLSLLERGGMVA